MLNQNSIHGPKFKDPNVKVRILQPIYVAGQLCEADTVMAIAKSDALVLSAARPPTVEIIV